MSIPDSLDQAIQGLPVTKEGLSSTRVRIGCYGGQFLDGYVLSIIGVGLLGIADELHVNNSGLGFIGAAPFIGTFIGSIVFGVVADRVGRTRVLSLVPIAIVASCILSAFVIAPWQLIVLRFAIGAVIGADYTIGTTLLAEFTPPKRRGAIVGTVVPAWCAGVTSAYLIGACVIVLSGGAQNWRWLLASGAVGGVVLFGIRLGAPESPYWLAQNGRVADTEVVVDRIQDLGPSKLFTSTDPDNCVTPSMKWSDFMSGEYARRLIMCLSLYLAVEIPMYTLLTFFPTVLSGFSISGESSGGLIAETAAVAFLIAGSIPYLYFIDRRGRRTLTVNSLGALVLPLIGLWLWAHGPLWFIVGCFCLYNLFCGGLSVVLWVYPAELFPTEYRASTIGFIIGISSLATSIATYLLPLGIAVLGSGIVMLFEAVLTAATFIVCLLLAPETRGNSLEHTSRLRLN